MLITMLKSKIHRATITGAELDYEGSIAIDSNLLKAARILPHEKVQVVNLNNGSRFETYAIAAKPASGEICLNGPAARLGLVGDKVIIISYCQLSEAEVDGHEPVIVKVGNANKQLI
jgi:aspartate 1-decarboxylase